MSEERPVEHSRDSIAQQRRASPLIAGAIRGPRLPYAVNERMHVVLIIASHVERSCRSNGANLPGYRIRNKGCRSSTGLNFEFPSLHVMIRGWKLGTRRAGHSLHQAAQSDQEKPLSALPKCRNWDSVPILWGRTFGALVCNDLRLFWLRMTGILSRHLGGRMRDARLGRVFARNNGRNTRFRKVGQFV